MSSASIRLIVILAILCSAGIIITQTFWVRSAYTLHQREFSLSVNAALREVAQDIMRLKQQQASQYSPVKQQASDFFIVETNVFVEKEILQHYLATSFIKENILTDFEYALYDCTYDKLVYRGYYDITGQHESVSKGFTFPKISKVNYVFGVHFPNRKAYLTSSLSVWVISTAFLTALLSFLGYMLFIIFKQKRLREIQKDFINNMTHEFKTPLSTIKLSAEVLKSEGIASNPQRLLNYATIISEESAHLTRHVERVLQMEQASKGVMQLKRENFIWQDLINQVVKNFELPLKAREGKISVHFPDNQVFFNGDILHLKNVIGNLIDNAIKYCDNTPDIHIFLKNERKHAIISVRDNGIGIDKQYQKFLFKKFYRVPTGNVHNVKGFGLGLNYVKIITEAHEGNVAYISQINKGSTFTLTFPYKHF